MNKSLKSERGAITLVVLVTMLFLIAFLMTMFLKVANKAQTSAETTEQIKQKYNNLGDTEIIYQSYFSDENIIPIYTVEQLKKIGSGEQVEINGKIYTFATNGYYVLETDLDLGGTYDEETDTWSGEWESITNEFTGVLDGIGHEITGLYINNSNDNQGLFGELNGTVKNLNISKGYIKANDYVGAIAGKNNGTIKNCYNQVTIEGKSYIGGIAGNLNEGMTDCYNTGLIIGENNVTGGYFKSITTGEILNNVWSDDILSENTYFVSGEATATAPKGFKVSKNVFEQTIKDGMVIQDSAGNEFVWIPVEVTKNDTKENIAVFYRSEWEEDESNGGKRGTSLEDSTIYTEPFENGYEEEEAEYKTMLKSVYENKGFYIGRYQAGTESPRTKNTEGTTTNWVVQRDKYPYIYVCWGLSMATYTEDVNDTENINRGLGALALCKGFYPTDPEDPNYKGEVGVTCTLCYGVQWDTMLNFVKDEAHNVINSTTWGNYLNNAWRITREEPIGTSSPSVFSSWKPVYEMEEKTSDVNILLTTGASDSFAAKNIYDVAGNVLEWTNEAYSTNKRVRRGGRYNIGGNECPASYRSSISPNYCHNGLGFRPVLYIK